MNDEPSIREAGFYEVYSFFARTVRTWFIAYGIGLPVLLFTNSEVWRQLPSISAIRWVVYPLLGGVAFQVSIGLIYKYAMWFMYQQEIGNLRETDWQYRVSEWLSDWYLLEIAIDLITLALFIIATAKALELVGVA